MSITTEIQESAPVLLIRDAMKANSGVAPEHLRELLAVRRDWEADEARKAYNLAISEFQAKAPIVEKGDDANGKAYAAIDRIWRTIRPIVTDLGLAVTWQVCELREATGVCHLEGRLSHRDGHGEKLVFDIPIPDPITNSSGRAVQNKAQVFGSAVTYAKRYATCGALGVVTGADDDGNGGAKSQLAEKEMDEVKQLLDVWRGTPGHTEEKEEVFWRFAGAPKLSGGSHDFGKIAGERFGDLKWYLDRAIKSSGK